LEPVVKKTVQDKRMKTTRPQKFQVIAIAIAACLSPGDLRARRQEQEPLCAVLGAMGEQLNVMEDYGGIKVIAITMVEDYVGESGREMIIPPVKEISNLVSTAYQSLGEEEDAACLSMCTMGEQSYGFEACLIQKAVEEQSLVEEYRTREEGEIAPRDALYPTMRVLSSSGKQPTHHRISAMHESTYQGDVHNGTYQEDRSCAKDVVMKRGEEKVKEEVKTEYRMKMEYPKMLYTRIFRPCPGVPDCPVSVS
jgi:hypothetical protein